MDIYLDNAATSHPKPLEVLKAVRAALTEFNANPGRSGHRRALEGARVLMACREALALALGVSDPMLISYQFNCTDALNLAIKGILRPGDHAIATTLEHNSVLRVLTGLENQEIDFTLIDPSPDGFVPPEKILSAVNHRTRLVIVTQASNVTGALQPVAAIGSMLKREGVLFLIDGAQALGATPVDVKALNCDLYAFPGHKGLLGPQGTGGLYVREGLTLKPLREGGTGSSSESMRQPDERPERYESGTLNLPGIAGLEAGAKYLLENFLPIRARERALTEQLLKGLSEIEGVTVYGTLNARDRVGVVSFNVGDFTSGAVADSLSRRGFAVRGGLHCAPGAHRFLGTLERGAVRASVGYRNDAKEIDAFLRAVSSIASDGLD